MSSRERSSGSKGPVLLPLAVVLTGVLLLLSNYFLLNDFNVIDLWPILLVVVGAYILLRGDLVPSDDFRTFGITRGSIESATLEINSGEIDVNVRALQTRNTERLIAGQYANQARPDLDVRDVHANLLMERQHTPWLSFADWEMGLSQDLPWQIVMSSYLGQANMDLRDVIIQNVLVSTGIGDVHLVPPREAFETLYVRSLVGNINIMTPSQQRTRITVEGGYFFGVQLDSNRYEEVDDGVYVSRDGDPEYPLVDIVVTGTFGDTYLS
ncbi:MAG: DUF5668 domain-containing protein [Chloroflexota bacterium]